MIPNGRGSEVPKGLRFISVLLYKPLGNIKHLFSGTNSCRFILVYELLYILFSATLHIAKTKMLHLFHVNS